MALRLVMDADAAVVKAKKKKTKKPKTKQKGSRDSKVSAAHHSSTSFNFVVGARCASDEGICVAGLPARGQHVFNRCAVLGRKRGHEPGMTVVVAVTS